MFQALYDLLDEILAEISDLGKAFGAFVAAWKGGAGGGPPQPPPPPPPPPAAGRGAGAGGDVSIDAVVGAIDRLTDRLGRLSTAGFGVLGKAIDPLSDYIGKLTHGIAGFVAAADPAKVYQFDLAVKDMVAVVGRLLSPALDVATKLIRMMADAIISLSPETQKAATATAVAVVALGGFTAAVAVFRAVVVATTGGLGAIVGLVVSLAAGLLVANGGMDKLTGLIGQVFDAFSGTIDAVVGSLMAMAEAAMPLVGLIGKVAGMIVGVLGTGLEILVGMLSAVLTPLLEAVGPLVESLGDLAKELGDLWRVIGEFLKVAITFVTQFPLAVVVAAVTVVAELFKMVIEFVQFLARELGLMLSELGGAVTARPPREKKSSEGAAVTNATFTSAQSYAEKAYASAYSLGRAQNHAEETAKNTETMKGVLIDIKGIVTAIRDFMNNPIQKTGQAIGDSFRENVAKPSLELFGIGMKTSNNWAFRQASNFSDWIGG